MGNIINLDELVISKDDDNKLEKALKSIKENKNSVVKRAIETDLFCGDEICLIAEEACRYENIDFLRWVLVSHNEILYYNPCEILDIAVNTLNIQLLKIILNAYSEGFCPKIKYVGTYERIESSRNLDVIDLLIEYNVL